MTILVNGEPAPSLRRGGGVRKAAAAAPSFPPTIAELTHHYDFSDKSKIWNDNGATVPITDGALIRAIENKGTHGGLAEGFGNSAPTWREDVIGPGLSAADYFDSGLTTRRLRYTDSVGPFPIDLPNTGISMGAIMRPKGTVPSFQQQLIGWAGNFRIDYQGDGINYQTEMVSNPVIANIDFFMVANQWTLVYYSHQGGGLNVNDVTFNSPGPEVAGAFADPGLQLPGPSHAVDMESITNREYDLAESFILVGDLISTERAAIEAYANAKYGALPHA